MSKHRHHDHSNPLDRYSRVLIRPWAWMLSIIAVIVWGIIIGSSIYIRYIG